MSLVSHTEIGPYISSDSGQLSTASLMFSFVREPVGAAVGAAVVGTTVGNGVGDSVGTAVGDSVGDSVGET